MNYKKAIEVSNIILIISMIVLAGIFFFEGDIVTIALIASGLILIIIAVLVRIIFCRCPHCKKALHLGYGMEPKICPKCREKLL